MGVSGSGKTAVGRLLAEDLLVPFIDADDHHPLSNIEKMSRGFPLNDADREPWLDQLNKIAKDHLKSGCVIACSALKEIYRKRLRKGIEPSVVWIYLKGTFEQIYDRMEQRQGHFMRAGMLRSQFEALEEPKNAMTMDIADAPAHIVEKIISQIN